MPVTLTPWDAKSLQAVPIKSRYRDYDDDLDSDQAAESLKASSIRAEFAKNAVDILPGRADQYDLLQSSYIDSDLAGSIVPCRNGLFQAVTRAYSGHHHLTIRPEDVWFQILAQFSAYVNAHSEELRAHFVAHDGQKELVVKYYAADRFALDWSRFPTDIGELLEKNVVDPSLRAWILPKFSTTTPTDTVIASVMMMGALQKYFRYTASICCGLPSVTLLGEKSDWEEILKRLDKLETYGKEPTLYASLLRPILRRFVRSFEEPESEEVIKFWHDICIHRSGSGMDYYNGWITAFTFWDGRGQQMYHEPHSSSDSVVLDGMVYGSVDTDLIPAAWVKVPVKIDDHGEMLEAEMIAGTLGIACDSKSTANGEALKDGSFGLDAMQPSSGWWIFEKGPYREPTRQEQEVKEFESLERYFIESGEYDDAKKIRALIEKKKQEK